MKLCTFKVDGKTRVGALTPNGKVMDVNLAYTAKLAADDHPKPQLMADVVVPADMIGLIESGDMGLSAIKEAMAYVEGNAADNCKTFLYAPEEIKFEAPVPNPQKIIAVVVNTKEAVENAEKPENPRPLYFMKPASCVTGPFDPIEIPSDIGNVGSEVELAVVIGKKGKFFEEKDAMSYVYGYTVHNDVPCHDLSANVEWIKTKGGIRKNYTGRSKCMDTFSSIGPWLVTIDEIEDPNNLDVNAWVNDVLVQTGNTSEYYFKIPEVLSYCSYGHTMLPGDFVSMGTVRGHIEGMNALSVDLLGRGGNLISEIEGIGKMINPIKPI